MSIVAMKSGLRIRATPVSVSIAADNFITVFVVIPNSETYRRKHLHDKSVVPLEAGAPSSSLMADLGCVVKPGTTLHTPRPYCLPDHTKP
jgi:hypothetical protein